jgi:5'-nucleotidase / UDP-sugar diphosphatase
MILVSRTDPSGPPGDIFMTSHSRRDTLKLALTAGATMAVLSPRAVLAEGAVTVTFLLTNDLYEISEEKGRGGMARLAAIVKAERAKSANVLFAHAGDAFSPSLQSGFDHGAHMVDLLNDIAPDIFVPGNHEFDFGRQTFMERVGEAKFPIYAANLGQPGGGQPAPIKASDIVERGGVRIGIVGSCLETTASLSSPGDLSFAPSFETVRDQAKSLRDKGADFIVAVVHTDRTTDFRMLDAHLVDLILTGHDHDLRTVYDGKTAMAESGEDAEYVVAVDIVMALKVDGAKRTLSWWPEFRIIDTKGVTPDPDMAKRVKAYEDELSKELDVTVATLGAELDSRSAMVRSQETAIGDLVADAIRSSTGADAALTNGGGIRANKQYPAGAALTRRDILSELPFGNRTVVTEITGAALRKALENGFSQIENKAGRFPQVSNMAVVVDPRKPAGQRVESVSVGGQPLDDARTYKIATNDFMLRGGDGYASLQGKLAATVDSGGALLANDVMVYAKKLGTVALKPEGRIVLK